MQIPFPSSFEKRVLADDFLGEKLLNALNTETPTTIRKNPYKPINSFENEEVIAWCENAYRLKERPSFTMDPLFHSGTYYPQEAGSMVLDSVLKNLDLPDNPFILDLCAAPGGKSTLIASFFKKKGLLVANDVITARSRILYENLTKWGVDNIVVTNNDPKDFQRLPHFFDAVLIDAPCSGEGMFRKTPHAREEWSEDNINLCSARQKRIVHDVWDTLKPGGFLIYSTCTFNADENENNVRWMIDQLDVEKVISIPILGLQKDRENLGYYCFPHTVNTEGYYFAVLQKSYDSIKRTKLQISRDFTKNKENLGLENWIDLSGKELFTWRDKFFLLPENISAEMVHIQQQLRIVKIGCEVGKNARKGLIPSPDLALHSDLKKNIQQIELTEKQALLYLKNETFPLTGPIGLTIATYKNIPLGFIKNLGNRFNNLWNKDWRIRKSI
jgi:16S rRNA C967 or C1407 C5-methylase (RsmB/RsmF family)/NOL1/NOP2/fmu family ribosome biogenesis protein